MPLVISDVAGSDRSWLAVDQRGQVAWFTINGSGTVPSELRDAALLARHEDALEAFVREAGLRFPFGAGDQMWRDAAARGIFAFDWSATTARYELIARPTSPILIQALPASLRELCTVRLSISFTTGHVMPDEIH